MARGSNYFNNNQGVALQASAKKGKIPKMIACQYGAGCNRSDCIYSHPANRGDNTDFVQSKEPCMAYLTDMCAFSAKGCRKRHPQNDEAERLIAKYQNMKCRFGDACRTNGCLYQHPSDEHVQSSSVQVQQSQNVHANVNGNINGNGYMNDNMHHSAAEQDMMVQQQSHYQQYRPSPSPLIYVNPDPRLPKSNMMDAANWGYSSGKSDAQHGTNSVQTQPPPPPPTPSSSSSSSSLPVDNIQSQDGTNINAREFVPGNW
jgi:hypothetical protein